MNPSQSIYPSMTTSQKSQFAQDVKNQKSDRQARKEAKHNRKFPFKTNAISILGAVGLVGLNAVAMV